MGREVVIPTELNIKELPFCFQFYDCILEMLCKKISGEQKVFLARLDQHKQHEKTAIKNFQAWLRGDTEHKNLAIDVDVPLGERISKYLKNVFSKDDLRDHKSIQDKEYHSYLQLYRKA